MRIALLLLVTAALSANAEHGGIVRSRGGGFHGSFSGGAHRAPAGSVSHMRQVQVSHPAPIVNQSHFVHDNSHVAYPAHDGGGRQISRPEARTPPAHHAGVVHNEAVVRDIRSNEGREREAGHYYWHEVNGVRYSHFLDRRGVHWYGFYVGPSFYWTRWWSSRWWWYDPVFFRWVYWHDNYWWWQGPNGLVYVYVDNNYYPYDEVVGGVTTSEERPQQPASGNPPSPTAGKAYYSPDGRRMIQIFGDRGEAFLYDVTGEQPKFLSYAAANVTSARFTGGTRGKPLEFLLDFKDGTFALFDADGHSLSGVPEAEKPVQAAPSPPTQTGTAPAAAPETPVQPPPAPEPGEVPGNPPPQNQ